jgi:MFS family permease
MSYYFASSLSVFYSVAVLFGFTYGGVMPLYAVLARENFPLRMMGTIIGGTAMAGSFGMATGPPSPQCRNATRTRSILRLRIWQMRDSLNAN